MMQDYIHLCYGFFFAGAGLVILELIFPYRS